jgi:hypothetical protein
MTSRGKRQVAVDNARLREARKAGRGDDTGSSTRVTQVSALMMADISPHGERRVYAHGVEE